MLVVINGITMPLDSSGSMRGEQAGIGEICDFTPRSRPRSLELASGMSNPRSRRFRIMITNGGDDTVAL